MDLYFRRLLFTIFLYSICYGYGELLNLAIDIYSFVPLNATFVFAGSINARRGGKSA